MDARSHPSLHAYNTLYTCDSLELAQQQLQSSEALVADESPAYGHRTAWRQRSRQHNYNLQEVLYSSPCPYLLCFILSDCYNTLPLYTYQVSGPGLQSATANHPTHALVELSDSSGRPCSLQQNVTAELELISEATPTAPSEIYDKLDVARWNVAIDNEDNIYAIFM